MKKIFIVLSLLLIGIISHAQQMNIQVNGNVTFDNSLFSITEAGNDFVSSITNDFPVNVSLQYTSFWDKIFSPNKKWRLNVQKSDILWHSDLKLEIIRIGNGDRPWRGNVVIHDGTNYQLVTNTSTYFFRGQNEISNVPLYFKLSDYSVTMGAKDFETNILLTVYDD